MRLGGPWVMIYYACILGFFILAGHHSLNPVSCVYSIHYPSHIHVHVILHVHKSLFLHAKHTYMYM